MSETQNIATMAEILSDEIFKWLKWEKTGTTNIDFDCMSKNHKKSTHPTDVVFTYYDPYNGKRIYLNCDLKSYADKTLSKKNLTNTLQSLAMSIDCAELSQKWKDAYLMQANENYEINGLLFIFNHDNSSNKSITDLLSRVNFKNIPITKGKKIFVFSPDEINYFNNIVQDLKSMKADDKFKSFQDYTFYYPDLKLKRRHNAENDMWSNPATVEQLTSPWLIVKYRNEDNKFKESYIVYYRGRGETVDEFVYLIDTLSAYQLVSSDNEINVRFYNSSKNATSNFRKAITQYLQSWNMDTSRKDDLGSLRASSITNNVTVQFNDHEIGMNIRGWNND